MSKENKVEELPEDIEVIGPGQMLAQAREAMGLTQQDVADKLNFRTTLVKDIEQEIFDKSLPATFNRGYLRNYAKLVNICVEDVLTSYEMLNVAQKQGAEMQSFSKQTQKQAENTRIMWISYLILALLIAATVIWWFQDSEQKNTSPAVSIIDGEEKVDFAAADKNNSAEAVQSPSAIDNTPASGQVKLADTLIANGQDIVTTTEQSNTEQITEHEPDASQPLADVPTPAGVQSSVDETPLVANDFGAPKQVEFTFAGDCWVNIYDATGERIAWGIKKSGYVMNISGQAPFTITLGKPELVSIIYQHQAVDMSQFSRGNIAKFTLPIE